MKIFLKVLGGYFLKHPVNVEIQLKGADLGLPQPHKILKASLKGLASQVQIIPKIPNFDDFGHNKSIFLHRMICQKWLLSNYSQQHSNSHILYIFVFSSFVDVQPNVTTLCPTYGMNRTSVLCLSVVFRLSITFVSPAQMVDFFDNIFALLRDLCSLC